MIVFNDNFSKRSFWRFINKKMNRLIHHYHIFSVISILFDEMVKDLKKGKEIKIFNFGVLKLMNTKPRKYHDFRFQKVMQSDGHKIMKFTLNNKIKKKICSHLDIEKTFKDD